MKLYSKMNRVDQPFLKNSIRITETPKASATPLPRPPEEVARAVEQKISDIIAKYIPSPSPK